MKSGRRLADTVGFWAALGLAVALFAWRWAGQARGLAADQAESLVLAQSLIDGLGLRLSAASSALPGPPNLVWLGVQAAVLRLGLSPDTWLPRVSLMLLELALVTVALRGALVWRRHLQVQDALPALGLSLTTALSEAAALGSGGSVWVLALAVVSVLMGRALTTGRSSIPAIALALVCLVRPSALWLLLAGAPAWGVAARVEGRPGLREVVRYLAAGLFVVGLVFLFRLVVLGAVPMEGVLPSHDGSARTLEFLARQSRWFWAALTGLMIAGVWRRFHLRGGATLAAWVLMTVVLANWTDSARTFFLGCVPLLAMLVGDGLSAAREGVTRKGQELPQRALSWAAIVGLVVMLSLATAASYSLGPIMALRTPVAPLPAVRAELAARGVQQPFVVWADAAEAAALFPDARIVVVRRPSLAVEDLLMSEGPPDVVDRRVTIEAMPRLGGVLSAGAGAVWWLGEQSPDDDPRCPEGRLSLLSTSPEQLIAQLEQDLQEEQVQRGLSRWRCALAALEPAQLPNAELRQTLAERAGLRAGVFEAQGRLELAVRAAALAASVSGEAVQRRATAERLRERWLAPSE